MHGRLFQRPHAAPIETSIPPGKGGRATRFALIKQTVWKPAKGIAEMTRVAGPGGIVAAYVWDIFGDGLPAVPLQAELLDFGVQLPLPPRADVSRMEVLRALWKDAGLEAVETREITVRRTFSGFDDFWRSATALSAAGPALAGMAPTDIEKLKARLRERLPADASGHITYSARANAVKGRVPTSP